MLIADWITLLALQGDPYERKATSIGLPIKFNQYAEFWGRFVFPNRDLSGNPETRLKLGFPVEVEDIYNIHYSVLYHFTFAFEQLSILKSNTTLPIEISHPFYHLATACDLIERLLLKELQLTEQVSVSELNDEEYKAKTQVYWEKNYKKQFKKFDEEDHRSVSVSLHSQEKYIPKELPHFRTFESIAGKVREYRNIFTHSISPLRLRRAGKTYLPKSDFIKHYKRWSAGRDQINQSQFEEATIIVENLAEELVKQSNELWINVIGLMDTIASMDKYRSVINVANAPLPYPEIRHFPLQDTDSNDYFVETGGSAEYRPAPLVPSGYEPD